MLPVAIAEAWPDERKQTETEIVRSSGMADSSTKEENDRVKGEVPQAILEAILKEVAALAQVGPDQVAIAHAESVVWSDGSLGCSEPRGHLEHGDRERRHGVANPRGARPGQEQEHLRRVCAFWN